MVLNLTENHVYAFGREGYLRVNLRSESTRSLDMRMFLIMGHSGNDAMGVPSGTFGMPVMGKMGGGHFMPEQGGAKQNSHEKDGLYSYDALEPEGCMALLETWQQKQE